MGFVTADPPFKVVVTVAYEKAIHKATLSLFGFLYTSASMHTALLGGLKTIPTYAFA